MNPLSRSLAALFLTATVAFADDKAPPATAETPPAEKKPDEKKDDKPKEEKPKEHAGQVTLGGAEVKYLAQTGTIPVLKDDGAAKADVFYVYYAATDADGKRLAAKDASTRPITFCFNGGPGASAVWLHLGGLGPRRLDLPADGLTPATVARNMRPEFDPSFSNIVGGFSSAVNAYVRGELGYESDHPYHLLAGLPWKWSSFEGRYVSTEDRLARAMKTNPRLRVLVLAARRDLACPEDALRHSLGQIGRAHV